MHVGLIVPSSNTVMEEEVTDYAVVHATRISLKNVDEPSLKKMNEELKRALELVSDCYPDVIVYGCTSGSFIEDIEPVLAKSSIPAVTTSHAIVSALQTLKVNTVSVATPYTEEITQKETQFLKSHGFTVVDAEGLGLLDNRDIGNQQSETVYDLAQSLQPADALVVSCTNLRTFDIICELEDERKTPVVTSNQASLWSAFKAAHKKEKIQLGTLLEEYL
jgi:maleate isomerase